MRVLTYVPLNPVQPRIHARTVECIDNLSWRQSMPVVYGRNDTPNPRGKYYDLRDKHNEARRLTLDGGYDALLLVEADMIIPPNALELLAALDVPVAYSLYVTRFQPHKWLALTNLTADDCTFVSDDADYARRWFGDGQSAIETCGAGMGCTLIKSEVLETLSFRLDRFGANADDWAFALDCIAYSIPQITHCGVICGHIDGDVALWPDVNAPSLVRREHL